MASRAVSITARRRPRGCVPFAPVPSLPVDDSELYYETRGAGEPLLLIQGMAANSTHWGEPFLAQLERDFEVIVYDHRGSGRSGPLPEGITTASLAADALALLDGLRHERVHVFGFSLGGMVAQVLALDAPERVRTLTLGATSCGGTQSKPTDQEVVTALTAAALSRDMERLLRTGFDVVVSAAYAGDPANYEAFRAASRSYPPTVPLLLAQQRAAVTHDAYSRLRGLDVPTLVVHGKQDGLLSWINGDLVASLIPGARLELLEGVGHVFFWEQPERAARLVREHAASADD